MRHSSHRPFIKPPLSKLFGKILSAVAIAAMIFGMVPAHPVSAATVPITASIPSFTSSNIQAFNLVGSGNTAALVGSQLRLTSSGGGQMGAAWWNHRISLSNNRSFSSNFSFQMTAPGNGGADGLTFTLQTVSNTAGASGGGLGVGGLTPSFTIEFDTYQNTDYGDVNANHIGVDVNGNMNSKWSAAYGGGDFKGGGVFYVWVDYDGSTDKIELRINPTSNNRATSNLMLSSTVASFAGTQLYNLIGQDLYVGFTASTGGSYENHFINSFYFNNDYISGGINPQTDTYVNQPYAVSLTPASGSISHTGSTTLTAHVTDVLGNAYNGADVVFTTSLGSLSTTSAVTTNSSGDAPVTLNANGSVGAATVRATATGGAYGTATVNLTNLAPTNITLSNTSVNEDQSAGLLVGSLGCSDPENDPCTYSVSGGPFNVVSGSLYTTASLDYETKSSYALTITADDGKGGTRNQSFTITVLDINDLPTNINLSKTNVNEDQAAGAVVGALSTVDQDFGDTFTYSLETQTGCLGPDNSTFSISGGNLVTASVLDYETMAHSYTVCVKSVDSAGASIYKSFSITLNNVNDPPTDISLSNSSANEDQAAGAVVGSLSTTDQDASDSFTYSLSTSTGCPGTDNSKFSVSGGNLVTASVLDYETMAHSYAVCVKSADSSGASTYKPFTVTLNDINDSPTNISLSNSSVNEDQAAGAAVGSLFTTDQDAVDSFTYSLSSSTGCPGTDNSKFSLSGDNLVTAVMLDYETMAHSYAVCVKSTDNSGASIYKPFTITLNDVNDPPTDISLSNSAVNEDQAAGAIVGALTTTDPDAGETFIYSLDTTTGCTGIDNNKFDISGSNLVTSDVLDYETMAHSYAVCVKSTDSGGASVYKSFTITLTDVNDAPTNISLSSTNVNENQPSGTAVGTFSTTDQDANGETFSYTLTTATGCSGSDNASFSISGNQLLTAASFNFEVKSSYDICVQSTDSNSPDGSHLSITKAFSISVGDVNEAPDSLSLSATQLDEDQPTGTLIGDLSATDPDTTGETFSYSLVTSAGCDSSDNSSFSVSGNQLFSAASLDYETQSSYHVCLRVTDSGVGALSYDKSFTITLNNVNDPPTQISLSNASIDEHQLTGATVGTLSTTDQDTNGETFTYSLTSYTGCSSTDNSSFKIVGDEIQTNAVLDRETQATYQICIETTDNNSVDGSHLSMHKVISVTLNDLNDPPTAISLTNSSVNEDQPAGAMVGALATTDADSGETFSYSLVSTAECAGADNTNFQIISGNLETAAVLDYETMAHSYTVCVQTTDDNSPDGTHLSFAQQLTVSLLDINDPPQLAIPIPDQTATTGSNFNLSVASDSFSDQDHPADTLTYSASLADGSPLPLWLSFDAGTITFSGIPPVGSQGLLQVKVTVSDGRGSSASDHFVLAVMAAGEEPPLVVEPLQNQIVQAGSEFSFGFSADAFSSPSGTGLTYFASLEGGGDFPAWLSFDPETRTFSGTPPDGYTGVLSITVTAADGNGGTISQTFTLTVVSSETNAPPMLVRLLQDQNAQAGQAFSFTIPEGSFYDADGDTQTYSAVLSDGNPLPAWLSFDPATQTFSGTPQAADAGSFLVRVTDSDGSEITASDVFRIAVSTADHHVENVVVSRAGTTFTDSYGKIIFPPGLVGPDMHIYVHITYNVPVPDVPTAYVVSLGSGREIKMIDGAGNPITNLSEPVTTCINFTSADFYTHNSNPSFFSIGTTPDTQTKWTILETTVDGNQYQACSQVSHFSLFDLFAKDIQHPVALPGTGFAPGVLTKLPDQPSGQAYQDLSGIEIEIPALGVKEPVMGVPMKAGQWDITWLGDGIGWLDGTAFPTWGGNTVLTGHNYLSNGQPGPFKNLASLKFGDQIVVTLDGVDYRYEVRTVAEVRSADLSVFKHEDLSWVTLITCQDYDSRTGQYAHRVVVRAVLIDKK
jgi:LPXTG-site transpeptidase (sortase) family protein